MITKRILFIGFFVFACAGLSNAQSQDIHLGAMGDSLTDEYQYDSGTDEAKNWYEQIVTYRSTDVYGGVKSESARPAPRYEGYEYNWARVGATSSTLLSAGQDDGLAAQVDNGDVTHSVLLVGHNDFTPLGSHTYDDAYYSIYNNNWNAAKKASYVSEVVSNIEIALDEVLAKGEPVLVCTFADYGVAPITISEYPNATKRALVSVVIEDVNDGIRELAEEKQVVLADLNSLCDTIFGAASITVREVEIDLSTSGVAASNAFTSDTIHPHSVLQGIMANLMMAGLNEYGVGLTPFTETELLTNAGLTGGSSDTLTFDAGDYVYNYTPEPATMCLLLPGLALVRRRNRS